VRELDGLRGVAVLLVLAGHTAFGAWPADRGVWKGVLAPRGGGLTGVQLFFVLSGYLITSILVSERDRSGRVSLLGFYKRRARRLVPALVILVAAYLLLVVYTRPARDLIPALWSVLLALTYTMNVAAITRWPNDGFLGHTWSLAVEEQFYIVWGLSVALLPRRWIPRVALLGLLVTVVGRSVLHVDGTSMYNLWRWDALLLGCMLACWKPRVPAWMGLGGGIVLLVYTFLPVQTSSSLMYLVTALACGALIMTAARWRLLRNRVLVWFGTISYGLYLWSCLLLRYNFPALLSAAMSVALAAASWYGVERHILGRTRGPATASAPVTQTEQEAGGAPQ
jgi:peptidoglycan/LPS O-acetylase OafA/YrhL